MIILIFLIIVIGGPLLISFIVFKIIKKYYPNKALMIGLVVFVIPYVIVAIMIYIDSLPQDDFYTEEFQTITELELPKSAYFKFKKATYPDFHGEYMSAAAISVNKNDFKKLLSKVKNSKKLMEYQDTGSKPYDWIKAQTGDQNYVFFASSNKGNDYHFIGFCKDEKTIIIHLVKW